MNDSQDGMIEKRFPSNFPKFSNVNEEFIESAMTLTSDRSKLSGHSLGNMLCGAISRRTEIERTGHRGVVFVAESGCPGIIDTGASKTVIGQGKVRELLRSLPSWVQKQVSWKKSETIFRFGNNAVLPSIGAVYIPFGSRWLKIEVVSGETPFLLSNSFLKAIDADVCTNKSCLRLNQCDTEIPLQANSKGLFVVELSEILNAISREHKVLECELITHVSSCDNTQQQPEQRLPTAKVAQLPKTQRSTTSCNRSKVLQGNSCHDASLCCQDARHASPVPREQGADLHDTGRGNGNLSSTRGDQSSSVGLHEAERGQAQRENLPGDCGGGLPVCHVDDASSSAEQRLGQIIPGVCESLEQSPTGSSGADVNATTDGQVQDGKTGVVNVISGVERERRGGDDHGILWKQEGISGDGAVINDGSRGGSRNGGEFEDADRPVAASTGPADQGHYEQVNAAVVNSISSQLSEKRDGSKGFPVKSAAQVISHGQQIMKHLEQRSQELQREVEHLLALMAEKPPTRVKAPRAELPPSKLDLLEVYCEPNSRLTEVALQQGLKARRFTREDGDLSTKEGQQQLWKLIEQTQPEHIWVAPECRYWGNFSRLNRSKSTTTAHKIDEGRKHEKIHLRLCCELFWHQVIHRRHFHLEQPQGSEALVQKELRDVVQGTYHTVFDMCEVGGLRIPRGNNFLRKRTIVLTTSKSCHGSLDSRYCQRQHQHVPIQGKMPLSGRRENLSAFAAKYSRGFARNVIDCVQQSMKVFELPMFQEELCVPCHGVREHDQEEAAAEIIKRRRLSYKQAEEISSPQASSSADRAAYGPAVSWKDIIKDAEKEAPRVGTIVIDSGHVLFHRVQMLVDSFDVGRIEVCRGTERYRVPKPGVDITHLTYRLTVILNRESGNVEVLGPPEKWQDLTKGKQIRKSRPARLCLTIFGNDGGSRKEENSPMKNLAEGDRSALPMGSSAAPKPEAESMDDVPMKSEELSVPQESEKKGEPDVDLGILGHPPKNVPRHGPKFLELGK